MLRWPRSLYIAARPRLGRQNFISPTLMHAGSCSFRPGRRLLHSLSDPPLTPPEQSDIEQRTILKMVNPITVNDSYVSCTTFDSHGNVTAVSEKTPKAQFLNENNLFPRDLRKVDSSSIDVAPTIMVRSENAIIVNLLHIKAIIKNDSIKIFDTASPSVASKLGLFMYDLELKLKTPSSLPYEFKALECILISVLSYLEAQLQTHLTSCGKILAELEDNINRESLQELLIKSKKLSSFFQRATLIRDVLEELLDNDEDLNGMYLTKALKYNPSDVAPDYSEIEMILETYYQHCDEVVQQAGSLISDIKATEEIANIILDANRNSLMLFELKVTIYTLGFTVATLVPAFYGMNLKNYIEDSFFGFGAVVALSIVQGLLITFWNFKKLHKVQTLTMMASPAATMRNKSRYDGQGMAWPYKQWLSRLLFGRRAKQLSPTREERDVIWRMIKNDKNLH
ncbi:hypothetical protein JCM33374_g5815 [Metschnikowia sp. JCM 33374]|nr:hypothetical protein JCM33374_g5815 [Metschnikowia sp. JCM 33374]